MKKIIVLLLVVWVNSLHAQIYTANQINGYGDFETFSPFAINMPPFILVDGDQETEYQLNGVSWANGDQNKAFMIFSPQQTSPAMSENWLRSRSGNNLLMAACNFNTDADNWFITPKVQLHGGHPKLSFYIQNYHEVWQRYRILVSTTDASPSSFTLISDGPYLEAAGKRKASDPVHIGWKKITFDLSAYANQAVHLAIHHVTPSEGIMMAIDDLSIDNGAGNSGFPIAAFSANSTSIQDGESVTFSNQSQNNPSTLEWRFPGGTPSSSTQANPTITYQEAGKYLVSLIASNSNGSDTLTKYAYIEVAEVLKAKFTTHKTTIYTGETIKLEDFSTGNPTSWNWNLTGASPATSTVQNPEISYASAGTYPVALTVSNGSSNHTTTKTSYLTVLDRAVPVADFSVSSLSIEEGQSIDFQDLSTGGIDNYTWSFAGASPPTSTAPNPSVTYYNEGTYTASLTVSNGLGSHTKSVNITVAQPAVNPCIPSTSGNGIRYIQNVTIGAINNTTGGDSYTDYTHLSTNVAIGSSYNLTVEANSVINFTSHGNKLAVWADWNLDGDFADADELIADLPASGTTYSVTIPVPNHAKGRKTTLRIRHYWNYGNDLPQPCGNNPEGEIEDYTLNVEGFTIVAPTADFSSNTQSVPAGAYVNFVDQSTNNPTTWEWTFNGGSPAISYDKNPKITYQTPGTYLVTLQVSNAGGTDSKTITGYITVTNLGGTAPTANFSASSTTITAGQSINFSDQSSNAPTSWSWSFPGGSPASSTNQNPTITYNTAGTYEVSLTASNNFGTDVETKSAYITVNPAGNPPVADFIANSTTINEGESVTFTDQSTNTPTTWSWSFEGGSPASSTTQNPTVTYNTAGTYEVSLTASNSFGTDVETKTAYITVSAINSPSYCESSGNRVEYEWIASVQVENFTNNSDAQLYSDFTNQTVPLTRGTANSITLTPGFSGTAYNEYFRVWIDYNQDGDFDDSGELAFDAGSASNAAVNGTITPAGNVALGTTRMRISMKYNSAPSACGDIGDGEVEDYTVNISDGTPTPPVAAFSANQTTINAGESVAFTDESSNNPSSWSWSFQGGSPATSADQNPTITYPTAGTYEVSLIVSNAAGNDTETKTAYITVNSIGSANYCTVTNGAPNGQYIERVQFGTIDNSSTYQAGGYSDYTAQNTSLSTSSSTTLTVTPQNTWTSTAAKAWIDWNGDGTFAANEEVLSGSGSGGSYSAAVTAPTNAVATTRMRVRTGYAIAINPCGDEHFSEVEDYTIHVSSVAAQNPFGIERKLNLTVFPNPSNGQFNLSFNQSIPKAFIQVVDLSGKKVMNESVTSLGKSQLHELDLRLAARGIYLIQVYIGTQLLTKKILIE
ncbi:MAG: PKD domain-containing protein [Flammeovirgaceae bacterium]